MNSDLALAFPGTTFNSKPSWIRRFFVHIHDHFIPHARNNYHPHILGHRALALFSVLLLSAKVASIAALVINPIFKVYSSDITATNVISLTNASRVSAGLKELSTNSQLNSAAQAKAQALLECQCFSHNIGSKTPWDFIKATGYQYLMAGENLAVNYADAETEHEAWMNSPGHRANILNGNFVEIGIGVISGDFQGGDSTIVVQMFGLPAEQNVNLSETPTPVAPKVAEAQAPQEQPRGLQPRAAQAAPEELLPPPPVEEAPKLAEAGPVSVTTSISDTALTR